MDEEHVLEEVYRRETDPNPLSLRLEYWHGVARSIAGAKVWVSGPWRDPLGGETTYILTNSQVLVPERWHTPVEQVVESLDGNSSQLFADEDAEALELVYELLEPRMVLAGVDRGSNSMGSRRSRLETKLADLGLRDPEYVEHEHMTRRKLQRIRDICAPPPSSPRVRKDNPRSLPRGSIFSRIPPHAEALMASISLRVEKGPDASWRILGELLQRMPNHLEANVLAGDLWFLHSWQLPGGEQRPTGLQVATHYYQTALAACATYADAWLGLSYVRFEEAQAAEALQATKSGLAGLGVERSGFFEDEAFTQLVAEALSMGEVLALGLSGAGAAAWDALTRAEHEFGDTPLVRCTRGRLSICGIERRG